MTEERLLSHRVLKTFYLLDFGCPVPGYRLLRAPCAFRGLGGQDIELGDWMLVQTTERTHELFTETKTTIHHHVVARWKETPTYELMFGMTQGESSAYLEELRSIAKHPVKWLPEDFEKKLTMTPRDGYLLVQAAMECGYNPGTYNFGNWLYEHLAKWLSMAPELSNEQNSVFPADRSKIAHKIGRFPFYYDMIETGDWDGEQYLYEPHVEYYVEPVRHSGERILAG